MKSSYFQNSPWVESLLNTAKHKTTVDSFSCHSSESSLIAAKMMFSVLSPTSGSSTSQAHNRKPFRKSWASKSQKRAGSFLSWRWGPNKCYPRLLIVKVREGGICPRGGQEFWPMPGTRSFIYSWCTHSLLISTEETSFSFSPPKRRSQRWLVSLDRVTLSSWPLSRQPVVHLYLRGTALTKTLVLFGNSLSFALPNKINLKWLGSSDTFSSKEHAFMWEGMSPGDSVQAVCLEFTSLSSAEHLQCIQRHAPGMKRDLGARFPGNGWKIWGCSAWRRENSGSFWEVSQWAVTMRKVYFGISQRKTETDVEKLQGGKLP